ncbi:ferredoxin [Glycomyces dulcitolivorans]|uniref:ferredoxin n=1 Tax=Glycomyces dulcitolivorans TaxID=2200759 RepID=UPI000DD4CC97|nr:ferredoxin [Glycomyces dulcitolivorans]
MRIAVDREACTSAGMCALTDPARFDQDEDDGRVVLLEAEARDGDPDATAAAELCPSGAVTLHW